MLNRMERFALAVLASTAWTPVVLAKEFPKVIPLSSLDGTIGFRLDGVSANDYSGRSVASAGDVNGDGFADMVIGADGADPHFSRSGSSYVVFGRASGFVAAMDLSLLDGSNGFRLDGSKKFEGSGRSVSSAGDINGDGFAEVIIGAPRIGLSYVVFGRAPDSARTRVGAKANQYISGGPFSDSLSGLGGLDVLEGRGGGDILDGGAKADSASYLHSAAAVKASLADHSINTGDAAGDTYVSIKNLIGTRFADELIGNGLSNSLIGAQGGDVLTGAEGADFFGFVSLSDSPPGSSHDKITDFNAGTAATSVDTIDLSVMDAETGPGDQAFHFVGTAASNTAGELRVEAAGTSAIIQGDVNGDGAADLEIELLKFTDLSTLTAIDFRL